MLRAGLTSLGILFGVASVIAMLAVGKGAEQEILEQMRMLGANNVIVTPIIEQKEGRVETEEDKKESKRFSPGLTYLDAQAIARTAKEFKVIYQKQPGKTPDAYTVDHSAGIYVFDREGRVRLFVRHDRPAEDLVHDVRLLLAG